MARGKNTAALFEVMGKGKAGGAPGKGPLGTPTWWNKGKAGEAPVPNLAPVPPVVGAGEAEVSGPVGPAGQNSVQLDPDRQELRVRVTYTFAAVALFVVVVAIGMAAIIGHNMGWREARPQTTTGLQRGPAEPGVLDVPRGNGGGGSAQPVEPNGGGGGNSGVVPERPAGGPVPVPSGKVSRTVGLTYVIAQSYPSEAEAHAVVELLASKGIAASAERVTSWNKNGWTVLSAEGFPRTDKASIDALKRKVDQVSVEQAQKDRKWKTLTPQSFRWQG